jgi:hypothetical protein
MKCHKGSSTLNDSLDKRPRLRQMDTRFSTRNAINLYKAGSFMTVKKEMSAYELGLVGV